VTVGAYLLHAPAVADRRYTSLKPQTQASALLRSPLWLVRQIRTEPLFHFGYAHPLPIRVVFHLVAMNFPDRGVFRFVVREAKAAHRACEAVYFPLRREHNCSQRIPHNSPTTNNSRKKLRSPNVALIHGPRSAECALAALPLVGVPSSLMCPLRALAKGA
jgi:hypothetical protein